MPKKEYCILYVDNSNIFVAGQSVAKTKGELKSKFRIYFKNFVKQFIKNRDLKHIVWAGSIPPKNDDLWKYIKLLGIEPDLIPRSSSGENDTVDHKIQLLMHRHVRKYKNEPGTIVLATGDGAGYENEEGFLYDIEGFVQDGWKIEVISWEHSCSAKLKKFATEKGKYIKLDDYYEYVTFIQNGRVVKHVK